MGQYIHDTQQFFFSSFFSFHEQAKPMLQHEYIASNDAAGARIVGRGVEIPILTLVASALPLIKLNRV